MTQYPEPDTAVEDDGGPEAEMIKALGVMRDDYAAGQRPCLGGAGAGTVMMAVLFGDPIVPCPVCRQAEYEEQIRRDRERLCLAHNLQ